MSLHLRLLLGLCVAGDLAGCLDPCRRVDESAQVRTQEGSLSADPQARICVRLAAAPLFLNPILAGDAVGGQITMGDVYEGLLRRPRPGAPLEPGLATHWERSADGLEYEFFLRDNVQFHDGSPLRSQDAALSIELAARAPGPLRAELEYFESATAEESTVRVRFRERRAGQQAIFADVPIVSSQQFAGVKPAMLAHHPASKRPIGTGPLVVLRNSPSEIELSRWKEYWGEPARAAVVVYKVLEAPEQLTPAFGSGSIDVAPWLSRQTALDVARKTKDTEIVSQTLPAYTAALFNTERLSLPARTALDRSVDRQVLLHDLLGGQGTLIAGPFGEAQVAHVADVSRLAAADLPKSLRILVPRESRIVSRLATIWARDLAPFAAANVEELPFAELLGVVRKGEFDVAFLSFTGGDGVDITSSYHSHYAGDSNFSRLKDTVLDELLAARSSSLTTEDAAAMDKKISERIRHLRPAAFLMADVRFAVVRSSVFGVGDVAAQWGARSLWRARR